MITRDVAGFLAAAARCAPDFGPATAKGVFLVAPDGFARADQSASDNRYMAAAGFAPDQAMAQHRGLHRALSTVLPVVCFAGDEATPDAVFPNNVFATAPGRLLVGRMRHPVRRREALRGDIRGFFTGVLGYRDIDLSRQPEPCELTGSMVIDRARGLGFCGLSERCTEAGARLLHEAFGLRATLAFDLAPGEYHANVLLAILGGRSALVCPAGIQDPAVVAAIEHLYAPHAILLDAREQAAFAANAIALSAGEVWMAAGAEAALSPSSRRALAAGGWALRPVALDAIEVAGGSLRCCVGEIF